MTIQRERPSRLTKLGFKVPVWMYRAHLGFLFGGRIFATTHHGRKSGKRYICGLEVLARYETEQPGTARKTLPKTLDGYDFSDEMRRRLAEAGTLIAFRPTVPKLDGQP